MNSPSNIWFFAEGTKYLHRGKRKTREWIDKIILKEGYKQGDINIIFCSDDYLHQINLKYLKHNTLTDIVTFNMSENEGVISGDIYISIERAKENARTYQVSTSQEVMRLIVHGILHLAGYKDKTLEDKENMRAKEDYYLSLPAN